MTYMVADDFPTAPGRGTVPSPACPPGIAQLSGVITDRLSV
ncbi:MAG: hypothetical protein QOG73_1044 [Acetobacteraceae bacterium]|jgi:hypothetical protein|nr:hypothetical protein [Acetobacteraceae bacterium]MEA2788638.1 hypothetical protein [Acetobacteraceae bacterium]